jgi:hypothetical protein
MFAALVRFVQTTKPPLCQTITTTVMTTTTTKRRKVDDGKAQTLVRGRNDPYHCTAPVLRLVSAKH